MSCILNTSTSHARRRRVWFKLQTVQRSLTASSRWHRIYIYVMTSRTSRVVKCWLTCCFYLRNCWQMSVVSRGWICLCGGVKGISLHQCVPRRLSARAHKHVRIREHARAEVQTCLPVCSKSLFVKSTCPPAVGTYRLTGNIVPSVSFVLLFDL